MQDFVGTDAEKKLKTIKMPLNVSEKNNPGISFWKLAPYRGPTRQRKILATSTEFKPSTSR